jgi:hypothetical protein
MFNKVIVIDESSLERLMTKVDTLHDKIEANNKDSVLENYYGSAVFYGELGKKLT